MTMLVVDGGRGSGVELLVAGRVDRKAVGAWFFRHEAIRDERALMRLRGVRFPKVVGTRGSHADTQQLPALGPWPE